MAADSRDPSTGAYIFSDTGAPDVGVDPTLVSAQANDVGTRIIRDSLAQLEAYPYKRQGLAGLALDTNRSYTHDGSGWVTTGGIGVLPFAMAAGIHTYAGSGFATVTLPAGRFTQPPIVTVAVASGGSGAIGTTIRVTTVTTTSFLISATNAAPLMWHAVQMLPGSAAG